MEDLIKTLLHQARMQQAVAMQRLDSGLQLFVYPLNEGVIVALGGSPDRALQAEDLLRKRSADPERYATWLPAMFNDGSLYVLRRLTEHEQDTATLADAVLIAAEELLN